MATITQLVDDIDGSPDAQTVRFALNGVPYEVDLSTKNLDKLEKALQPFIKVARTPGGQPVQRRTRRARGTAPASSDRIDYTDHKHFGLLHRGRVTEEEAALVRENLEQANKNRQYAGQPVIDVTDPKEVKRYGLS